MQSFKFTLVLILLFFLAACASSPASPTPAVDVSALSTQAVATVYAELTQAPPTAQPPLLIRATENARLTELAWSPGGQAIVTAACEETCQLNLYTFELSQVWSVEVAGTVSYLEYSPDGKIIAALVKNGVQSRDEQGKILEAAQTEIWLFNAQDGAFLRKWDAEQAVMLRFDPLGIQIATAGGPVILWEVATGKAIWRLEPIPAPKAEHPGHVKLARLSASPRYGMGGKTWMCWIESYDTVSFSLTEPVLLFGGKGLGYPRLDALDLVPCYEITSFDLVRNYYASSPNGFSYAFAVFGSEQFSQPQKIAWQVINSSSVSGLAVMNSGFYLPADSFSIATLAQPTDNEPPQLIAAQGWGLDFAAATVTGAAISPSAERAAVWGKTPDNPPAYFLNLFDARTAQQIAEVRLESDPTLETFSAAFSPDGRLLASIDRGGALSLWRVSRMQP